MASKSKRRRRVLRASCILAALIIAGSSFAWFTSSDEVVNRLSANADYDVKLVESFAPPANWLPGNEVDKDVYAVNTGSIAAFVKETVTSKITITREERVTTAMPTLNKAGDVPTEEELATYAAAITKYFKDNDVIELSPAERYSVEAGAFVALAPNVADQGKTVVAFVDDPKKLDDYEAINEYNKTTGTLVTDFVPTETGLYVFRRVVDVNNGGTQNHTADSFKFATEEFEYEGYYYDKATDKYYKVELTSITEDKVQDIADDGKDSDGILTDAKYRFFKEVKSVEVPELSYDPANHELLAKVKGFSYKPDDADFATLAGNYDKYLDEYEDALLELYNEVRNYEGLTDAERVANLAYIQAQMAELAAQRKYEKERDNYKSLKTQETNTQNALTTATNNFTAKATALYGAGNKYHPASVATPVTGYDTAEPTLPTDKAGWVSNTDYDSADDTYPIFDQYAKALKAYTVNEHDSEVDFITELKAYIDVTVNPARTAASKATINVGSYTTIEGLAAAMTYDEVKTFIDTNNPTGDSEEHDNFQTYADYLLKLKAYNDAVAEYTTLTNQVNGLTTQKTAVTSAKETARTNAFGTAFGTDPTDEQITAKETSEITKDTNVEGIAANPSYLYDWLNAKKNTAQKKYAYEQAQASSGNVTVGDPAANSGKKLKTDAEEKVATAKGNLDDAKLKFEQAESDLSKYGDILIHIGLTNEAKTDGNELVYGGTAGKWQLLPSSLEDKYVNTTADEGTDSKMDTATFYYTSILDGGATSNKLIDYVKLDENVTQDMFKSFDFDLDVKLDSIQISRDETDDSLITTKAVTAAWTDVTATLSDPTDTNTAVAWTANP